MGDVPLDKGGRFDMQFRLSVRRKQSTLFPGRTGAKPAVVTAPAPLAPPSKSVGTLGASSVPTGSSTSMLSGSAQPEKLNSWADIWREFSVTEIQKLRSFFDRSPTGGLTLHEFIVAAQESVEFLRNVPERLQLKAIAQLRDLFERIDVNADTQMTWEEFTAFLVDNSAQVFEEHSDVTRYQRLPYRLPRPYAETEERIVYIKEMKRSIMCCREECAYVLDPREMRVVRKLTGHKSVVLNAGYDRQQNILFTSAADRTLCAWEPSNLTRLRLWRTPSPQTALTYASSVGRMFTAGTDGIIRSWDINPAQDMFQQFSLPIQAHTDWVTDLVEIADFSLVLSASMDSKVHMIDAQTADIVHTLAEHAKGVSCLAYTPAYRASLSAGYGRDVIVWNPHVHRIHYRLVGHDKPVMSLFAFDNSPEVISADTSGRVKVWDIRTMQCMQTLEAGDFHFNCFSVYPDAPFLFAAGDHEWGLWKSVMATDNTIAVSTAVKDILYSEPFNCFVVCAAREITQWNLVDGKLLSSFEDAPRDMVVSVLNRTCRQLLSGDADGYVTARHSTTNGLLMEGKVLPDVAFLFYTRSYYLIAGSVKGQFVVLTTEPELNLEPFDKWTCKLESEVTGADYSPVLDSVVIVGGRSMELYSIHTCSQVGSTTAPSPISAVLFCDAINAILVADEAATFTFYGTSKLIPMLRVHHGIDYRISILGFCNKYGLLVSEGSTDGHVIVWDTSLMLAAFYAGFEDDVELVGGESSGSGGSAGDSSTFVTAAGATSSASSWRQRPGLSRFGTAQVFAELGQLASFMAARNVFPNKGLALLQSRPLRTLEGSSDLMYSEVFLERGQSISCIKVLENPSCMLLGTMSGQVTLWDFSGRPAGSLAQNGSGQWRFPRDLLTVTEERIRNSAKLVGECGELKDNIHELWRERVEAQSAEKAQWQLPDKRVETALNVIVPITLEDRAHRAMERERKAKGAQRAASTRSPIKRNVLTQAGNLLEKVRAVAMADGRLEPDVDSLRPLLMERIAARRHASATGQPLEPNVFSPQPRTPSPPPSPGPGPVRTPAPGTATARPTPATLPPRAKTVLGGRVAGGRVAAGARGRRRRPHSDDDDEDGMDDENEYGGEMVGSDDGGSGDESADKGDLLAELRDMRLRTSMTPVPRLQPRRASMRVTDWLRRPSMADVSQTPARSGAARAGSSGSAAGRGSGTRAVQPPATTATPQPAPPTGRVVLPALRK